MRRLLQPAVGTESLVSTSAGVSTATTQQRAMEALDSVWNWIKKRRESRRLATEHAQWRAELDRLGVWAVQKRVDHAGAGTLVYGFLVGPIEREFIELWLSEKEQTAARQRAAILGWARIAGWAGVFSVFLTILLTPEGRDTLRRVATSLSAWLFK